jgi:cold shock protein
MCRDSAGNLSKIITLRAGRKNYRYSIMACDGTGRRALEPSTAQQEPADGSSAASTVAAETADLAPTESRLSKRAAVLKGYLMNKGMVKWYNDQRGYGFIQPAGGGKDVFVHATALERSGIRALSEGQKVIYES